MKYNLIPALFIASLLCITFVSAVPKIEPYVTDLANVLTPDQELQLNLYADQIEKNTTWEIAIVTVQNTEGIDRVEYANRIGDENGVGKKDKDNGIVILYSLENGGAIATGRFSESLFNDAKVGRIGRENKHFFDDGLYYEGFNGIMKALESEIKAPVVSNQEVKTSDDTQASSLGIFWIGMIIFFMVGIARIVLRSDDDSSNSTTEEKKTYERYYPSKFKKKHKLIKKKDGKWYKRNKGRYDYVSPIMMAYLLGIWTAPESSSSSSSSSYHSSYSGSSYSGGSSGGSSSRGGFSGGSFGGGGFGGGGAGF